MAVVRECLGAVSAVSPKTGETLKSPYLGRFGRALTPMQKVEVGDRRAPSCLARRR